MPFLATRDAVLHYRSDGPETADLTVVFVNSLGTDFRIWDETRADLHGRFPGLRTVGYDKRGHGLSDLGRTSSVAENRADLTAVIDAECRGRLVVCGLSIGGQIAMDFASQTALDGLILCCTAPKIGNDEMWQPRIDTIRSDGIGSIADAILERWFSSEFRQDKATSLAGYRNMLARTEAEGYARACETIRDTDLTAAIERIDTPTLCVAGEVDGSTPPALVGEMAERIPGATLSVIPGVGHLPCVEAPAHLTDLIATHLISLEGAAE